MEKNDLSSKLTGISLFFWAEAHKEKNRPQEKDRKKVIFWLQKRYRVFHLLLL